MAYLDMRFPLEISYGSKGGPKFNTTVLTLASGHEKRNVNWSQVRAEYEAQHGIKDREQMEELLAFFYVCQGKAHSFRFKDFLDFQITDQVIGTGNGVANTFQVKKRYQAATFAYDRNVTKLVAGSLTGLRVNNVLRAETTHYTVNYNTGVITFTTGNIPPDTHEVKIDSVEFDVHCRFDTDHFDATHDFWETMSWPSIPIVELRGA